MSLSRRQMLKTTAGILLAARLWPRRAFAADSDTKPLKFIQINDLHYIDKNCAPFFDGLVAKLNAIPDAAFLLIVGDLVENGTPAQCNALKDLLTPLKIPYYVTCGNHDPASQTNRAPFEAAFGNKFNTSFDSQGWQIVSLDTADGTKSSNFNCKQETLDFAASLPAKLNKDKPTVLFTHFPLGPGVTNRLKNADALLEPFKQLNLQAIFTGHHHGFTEKKVLANTLATTDVCCSFKRANHDSTFAKGFFVLQTSDGKLQRTFTEYGTDFKGAATPSNKPLPTSRPAITDPSRPNF